MTDANAITGHVRCGSGWNASTFHRVVMHDDGRFETPDCPRAVDLARQAAAMIKLGDQRFRNESGCMPLVALCTGLPPLVAAGRIRTDDLGGWLDLYVRYETHKLVRATVRHAVEIRLAPNIETLRAARKALKNARYWRGYEPHEREVHLIEASFLFDTEPVVGAIVADDLDGDWRIPLQSDWLRNVGECRPVIDGRLVVGINHKHAGFVFAIDGDPSGGYTVREFAIVNGKLGRIKS